VRDKKREREARGLAPGGDATQKDVEIIRQAAYADSTHARRARLQEEFEELLERSGLEAGQDAFEHWVATRVINRTAYSTIKQEAAMLHSLYPGVDLDRSREKVFLRGAARCAKHVDKSRLNLKLEELVWLMEGASAQVFPSSALSVAEQDHRRLRDRAFFGLSFSFITRGNELASLKWKNVFSLWRIGGNLIARNFGQPSEGELAGVRIRLDDSKTDLEGEGQLVDIARRPSLGRVWSPALLLEDLHQRRRSTDPEEYVFARFDGLEGPLQASTFNTLMKKLLATKVPADRLSRLSIHSLRKGGTTAARAAGATTEELRHQGRWRSMAWLEYSLVDDDSSLNFSNHIFSALDRVLSQR
jgi:integrase